MTELEPIRTKRKPLEHLLLEGAFVKAQDLKAAQETAQRTGRKLTEVLLSQNLVKPEELATILSFQHGVPLIDLERLAIKPEALASIPQEIAREYSVLPAQLEGDVLTVVMDDPGNLQLLDFLSLLSHKRIRPAVSLHGGIKAAVDLVYPLTAEIQQLVSETQANVSREPTRIKRYSLERLLLEGAFVKAQELQAAQETAKRTGRKLAEVLLSQNLVTPETMVTILSFQYGAPIIDLKQFDIWPQSLASIPEEIAREYSVLPAQVDGDVLTVVMDDPGNLQLLDTLSSLSRKRIRPVLPLHGGVKAAVDANYPLTAKIQQEDIPMVEVSETPANASPEPFMAHEADSTAPPVVRAVDLIIAQAVKDNASDIHIEPREDKVMVRFRIDGILHEAVTLPLGVHAAVLSRIKAMANMNVSERRRPQHGRFSMRVADRRVDLRVASVATAYGELLILRRMDKSLLILNHSELGFSPGLLDMFKGALESRTGMILVSEPTASVKTTTLYAFLRQLDPNSQKIMTIEHLNNKRSLSNINRIQVDPQSNVAFARVLRAIISLDRDVILIGEIRDRETANVAVREVLSGHLVLSSVQANDAVGALVRLIDLGVEPSLVAKAVIATLSHRLVRKVCPYCRTIGKAIPADVMAYQQEMLEVRTDFYQGRGCDFCSGTGYLGCVAIFEILTISDQIRQLVNRQATAAKIRAEDLRGGMITLRHEGMLKARDGITTIAEVLRNVTMG